MRNQKLICIACALILCLCIFTACGDEVDADLHITITFIVDGEVYHEMEVKNDTTVRMPAEPQKDGFIFDGWYLSEDYEAVFTSAYLRRNTVEVDLTVYAKWEEEHEHTFTTTTVPPTATEQGYTLHQCTECEYNYKDNYVDALGESEGLAYSVNTGGETCTITGIGTCINTEISIPAKIDGMTVSAIAPYAFYNCSSLTHVLIPSSVTNIGDKAFYNCSGLTNMAIPDSVTSIGEEVFCGCSGLESITIPFVGATIDGADNTHFGYIFGAPTVAENNEYIHTSLTTVTITSGASIGNDAFSGCSSITNITIPNSVTSIGEGTFSGCSSITNITIRLNNLRSLSVSRLLPLIFPIR